MWWTAMSTTIVKSRKSKSTASGLTKPKKKKTTKRQGAASNGILRDLGLDQGRALLWAVTSEADPQTIDTILALVDLKDNRELEAAIMAWIEQPPTPKAALPRAYQALALGYILPRVAKRLSPETVGALVTSLVAITVEVENVDAFNAPLIAQLAGGELPLLLSMVAPDGINRKQLYQRARKMLSDGLLDLLDGGGLLHAGAWNLLYPLAACWSRCRKLGRQMRRGSWSKDAEEQFQFLLRNLLRLVRPDGSLTLSDHVPPGVCDLWRSLISQADDNDVAVWANKLIRRAPVSKGKVSKGKASKEKDSKVAEDCDLEDASVASQWSAAALLWTQWSATAPRITVAYDQGCLRGELLSRREILFSGDWQPIVSKNGEELSPQGDWEQVCWISDADVDYLELEISLARNVRVQRQICLLRDDSGLFWADAILSEESAQLDYRSRLPLGEDCHFVQQPETTEGFIEHSGIPRALVLPLSLPEWLCEKSSCSLQQVEGALEYMTTGQGCALYAGQFLDLKPKRFAKPYTWRQLTVAEKRLILPNDVAVGYRIQVGRKQWLIYRSLAEPANRTVLGHNLNHEFLAAHFLPDGTVEPLVMIE